MKPRNCVSFSIRDRKQRPKKLRQPRQGCDFLKLDRVWLFAVTRNPSRSTERLGAASHIAERYRPDARPLKRPGSNDPPLSLPRRRRLVRKDGMPNKGRKPSAMRVDLGNRVDAPFKHQPDKFGLVLSGRIRKERVRTRPIHVGGKDARGFGKTGISSRTGGIISAQSVTLFGTQPQVWGEWVVCAGHRRHGLYGPFSMRDPLMLRARDSVRKRDRNRRDSEIVVIARSVKGTQI